MSPRLKLVTGLAVAQTLASAVFITLRGAHLSLTVASDIAGSRLGGVIAVPTVILWIAVASLSIAWSFILVGAFDARWLARLGTLSLFTLTTSLLWLNSGISGTTGAIQVALVVLVWLAGGWTWWRRIALERRRADSADAPEGAGVATLISRRSHDRPRATIVAVVAVVVFAIYLACAHTPASSGGGTGPFASALFEQVAVMALLLIPALLLAGSEFGEWGEIVGESIARGGRQLRVLGPFAEGAGLAVIATAIAVHTVFATSSRLVLVEQIGLGVAVALVVAGIAWRTARGPARWAAAVPYVALVLAAITLYVVSSADLLVRTSSAIVPSAKELALGGDLIPYGQTTSPPFSIMYPSGWTVERVPPDYTIFNGADFGSEFAVLRVHIPADKFTSVTGLAMSQAIEGIVTDTLKNGLPDNPSVAFSNLIAKGPWTEQFFQLTHAGSSTPFMEGVGWERVLGNRIWVLYGDVRSHQSFNASRGKLFEQMWARWSPDPARYPAAQVTKVSSGVGGTPVYALGFWALVVLAIGTALARRRLRPRSRAGALLLLLVGLLFIAGGGRLGPPGQGFQGLQLDGIQTTVAVASLGLAIGVGLRPDTRERRRALLSDLIMLNVALQIAAWMYQVFGGALQLGGQFSIAQGLVVFAALIWELTFSGVTMTNRDSPSFPRHARVLIYCGYIMLVSTTVLFFSSLHVQSTGNRLEPIFESEFWARSGIEVLAVPLILTLFVTRFLRRATADGDEHGSSPEVSAVDAVLPLDG